MFRVCNGMPNDNDGGGSPPKHIRPRGDHSPEINWLAVRQKYHEGLTNLRQLAEHFGIARETISRKIIADRKAGRPWATRDAVEATAITDVTSRIAEKIANDFADDIAKALRNQLGLARAAQTSVARMLQKLGEGKLRAGKASEAEDVRSLVAAVKDIGQHIREIAGIERGVPNVAAGDADTLLGHEYIVAIAPEEETA